MFQRFTGRARRVAVPARDEARMLHHNYIGAGHLLPGLIHQGVAVKSLGSLGIGLDAARQHAKKIIGQGQQLRRLAGSPMPRP